MRHIIAIQRTKPPLLRVLCYVPAVRWVEKSLMTDSAVIGRVAKAYLDAGVLTREQFNTITKDVKK